MAAAQSKLFHLSLGLDGFFRLGDHRFELVAEVDLSLDLDGFRPG